MKTILVIDDEEGIRQILSDILSDEGYRVLVAQDGLSGMGVLKEDLVDCVVLDVWLPERGGLDVLNDIRSHDAEIPVVIISGHGSIDMAVKAVKRGAFDFIEKPLSLDRITRVVRLALEMKDLRRENEMLRNYSPASARSRLVGVSSALKEVREVIRQIGESDARVLIIGENGTGKELAAREIHGASTRRDQPFVAVNCAALPETLIETELFGHEKGAFTGAHAARRGKFEHAHGGTLFLDEVADMSAGAQAKVLRVIQEMRLQRVGGEETIAVDVRIIAATNKDISREIQSGTFREDLFFRLNVVPLRMPSLRERREDIPILLNRFLEDCARERGQERCLVCEPQAMEELCAHSWPGNVRELKNFAERVSIMAAGTSLTREEARRFLGGAAPGQVPEDGSEKGSALADYLDMGLSEARDCFERDFLQAKLRAHNNNISRTAQALGIYPGSLHGKIKKLGIEVER
ncbi:two-component system, NtrC family, nitrogen regulation response regulator NtrX [Alkalispirochaeta americana]|uniref:Two-component system, NtrC family, nitrogen regulation response regulator NtrX n=1 Tax=Alkalispirochaeta americana TaxID=159291 RepID=A0A1N6U1H3_9SPIO|nr:sigma-54 dependent transcriptional regulator [Alkalispirochaeta americana]SIQ59472.1 two-component system, NtrC family, nitrogen regulation response regulator NtrX [Alkalispirochaeta americana]